MTSELYNPLLQSNTPKSGEEFVAYLLSVEKNLPHIDISKKIANNIISGCSYDIWMIPRKEKGKLYFEIDSNSKIARGLIYIILEKLNGKSSEEILNFDFNELRNQFQLTGHASSRSNAVSTLEKFFKLVAKGWEEREDTPQENEPES